jgi:hypothetical protein
VAKRLTSALIASALIRRVNQAGGAATVLSKGDETAGSILVVTMEKGQITGILERILAIDDCYAWSETGPQDIENTHEIDAYLARRRSRDPDLWVIELDIAGAARFAAQVEDSA